MTETKEFPTAVIASLSSGVLLCDFSTMHEAAEFVMGHPIWTHHFANKGLWKAMQAKILEQCPNMPTSIKGVTKENYSAKLAEIEKQVGMVLVIRKGDGETVMHPLEGIPEGKPVVILQKTDQP